MAMFEADLRRHVIDRHETEQALHRAITHEELVIHNWLASNTKSAGAILDFMVLRAEEHARRKAEKETARKSATKKLDPITQIQRGSVILVHIANMPSYMGRSIYTSPIDGKNLNRAFPGNPNGTITERIADFLVGHVYPLADAVLDMHSGDANEQLSPSYTAYYGKAGSPQVIQSSKDMARAFGLGLTVEFQWELGNNDTNASKAAIWAGSAAVVRGIPSIDVEMAPGMGRFDSSHIDQTYQGVLRVMEHLGIIHSSAAEKVNVNLPQSPCLVKKRHLIEAQQE